MLVEGCEVTINMSMYATVPNWIKEILDHLKTQHMCNEAVRMESYSLNFVTEQYKSQDMCNEAVGMESWSMKFVPDHLKTKEMCEGAVDAYPWVLEFVLV